jgi:hypothetical protein
MSAVRALSDIRDAVNSLADRAQARLAIQAGGDDSAPQQHTDHGPAGPAAAWSAGDAHDADGDPFARALARLDAVTVTPPEDPVVVQLEGWLARIEADRDRRAGRGRA